MAATASAARLPGRSLEQRAEAQLLGPRAGRTPVDVVQRVVAVQAQSPAAARLAVRARSAGVAALDVDAACADGRLVRTWLMRGTLHMVTAADLPRLLRIYGARNAQADRGRRHRLGLDDELCDRALPILRDVLAGRALARDDVVEALAHDGVALDARSQAPAHLLMFAAARGVVCRGPEADADVATYALLSDVLDEGPGDPGIGVERAEASDADIAWLAARYATGHGPVTPADFAAWGGLPITVARKAFASLAPTDAGSAAAGPRVRLVGHFDPYLLGYASRTDAVADGFGDRLQSGGGFVMPAVLDRGRVLAGWKGTRRGAKLVVSVEPFGQPLSAARMSDVAAEVDDVGRFLNVETAVEIVDTVRTADLHGD